MDKTGDLPQRADGDWECGWDGHAAAQAEFMARLPLDEKLRWLEEAHELAILMLGLEGFERARALRVGQPAA